MEKGIYQNWLEIIVNTQHKFEFPSPKIVGSRLKEIRIKSGYSIRQVAGILDVSDKSIQRYESGQFYPRLDILY
jgi:DNA-binding XRE family transcriptional regulator